MLVDKGGAAGVAYLIPPYAGHAVAQDGMVHPERFVTAPVAVVQGKHQPVAQAVERTTRRGLRDFADVAGVGHGQIHRAGEGGVARVGPVHMKFPEVERVGKIKGQEVIGRAGRRRVPFHIGREETGVLAAGVEGDPVHGLAVQHGGAVQRPDLGPDPGGEHVAGEVVGVRPDAQFGVVAPGAVDRVFGIQVVEVPAAANGVAALRDGDALVGFARGEGKVGDDPAVGHGVVEGDHVAPVLVIAGGAGWPLEKVVVGDFDQRGAGGLVEDADGDVDHLDIVVGPDVAVGIGWVPTAALAHVQAGEVDQRLRHLAPAGLDLGHRVHPPFRGGRKFAGDAGWRCLPGRPGDLLQLRQVAQVAVPDIGPDRTSDKGAGGADLDGHRWGWSRHGRTGTGRWGRQSEEEQEDEERRKPTEQHLSSFFCSWAIRPSG